ncbi:chorismate mutase [Rhodoferax sp.]|uniref:chorismate mutase n=1 Tax=Rhodoferax sp. TaxID=50421 RepID=UPI00374D5300
MSTVPKAQHCNSMAEVRQHIDALDERIVALVAERSDYMTQAARIKQRADQIIDLERVEYIVARVKAQARSLGAPPEILEATYRAMIDASIVYEQRTFDKIHAAKNHAGESA